MTVEVCEQRGDPAFGGACQPSPLQHLDREDGRHKIRGNGGGNARKPRASREPRGGEFPEATCAYEIHEKRAHQ